MTKTNVDYNRLLDNLQYNWMATIGAPAIVVLLSLWVSPLWLPLVTLAMVPILMAVGRLLMTPDMIPCTLIRRYTEYGLSAATLVMILSNIASSPWGQNILGKQIISESVPYVPSLVLYSALTVAFLMQLVRQGSSDHCKVCASHTLAGIERRITLNIYHTQMTFMGRVSLAVAAFISAVGAWYFFTFYINVNFNNPDKFFFCFVPIGVTLLAIGYVYTHYSALKFQMATMGVDPMIPSRMNLRFLIIRDSELLMAQVGTGIPGLMLWDTPATASEPFELNFSDERAREVFAREANCTDFTLRRLYRNKDEDANAEVVYGVFLSESAEYKINCINPQWMTLNTIDLLYNSGQLTPAMQYDIHRIYTITMAWKTYTPDGHRLYPIKNYRPTFRLADFKDWDVNYEDTNWMEVYTNNEDRPMWRLRRLWRRLVAGQR